MQTESNLNARLIDKNNITYNIEIICSKFHKKIPRSNYSRNNPSLYFNKTDFRDCNELLKMSKYQLKKKKEKRR